MQEPFFGALDDHRPQLAGTASEDDVLVGMGAVILNGAVIREARESDREMIRHAFEGYVRKSEVHLGVEPLSAQDVFAG